MRMRSWLVAGLLAVAALLLVGRAASSLLVDHAWYDAMGVPSVFWEQLTDTVLLQGTAWLCGTAFAFANLHAVRRTILAVAVPSRVANLEVTAMIPPRRLLSITLLAATLIGLTLALPLTDWTAVALARHGVAFGEIEGILDQDLGFYVYRLPLEEMAYLWALASVVLIVTVVLLLYALTRSLRVDGRRIVASNHVRRHLSALGALVLLLLAWSYRLDSFDVLQRGSGPDGLFLRLDHVVTLPIDRALVVVCAIAAPILLRAGWMGQVRAALITLSVVLIGTLGVRQVLPIVMTRSAWVGEPARRDRDYQATRTLHSRRAFDVDGIRAGDGPATRERPALDTRVPTDELSRRISMWTADAARVRVADGRGPALDAAPAGWTVSTDQRIMALLVRRPTASTDRWTVSLADVTKPLLRDSVLEINIAARGELDEENSEPVVAPGLTGHKLVANPAGILGTPLRGLGMRIAHAWATRDPDLLDADTTLGAAPRLVSHRDVRDRVERLMPVLSQGTDVQPLLWDGALFWAVNLYSASDRYPLSQRWTLVGRERSYFRLAGTALVDANTGRVRVVPIDRPDPIARTWFGRIAGLIVAAKDMPPGLIDQLPAPTDGALAQAKTFARYGSRLEGSVARHFPDSALAGDLPPAHLVSGGGRVATAWSVPLLDGGDQLDGVLTAVGGRYRATFWDSTTVPRARWSALSERLRSALDSARTGVPDGSRREPRMRVGRVHVVPGERGPVLLQSLVWNRADGAPMIARVGVLDHGQISIGGTLQEAVASLHGGPSVSRPSLPWLPSSGAARDEQIARLYEIMRDAMRRGDWTRFGAAFDSLGLAVGKPPQ